MLLISSCFATLFIAHLIMYSVLSIIKLGCYICSC